MLIGLVAASLITAGVLGPLIRLSYSYNLLALPDQRRSHERAVPQIGGLAIFLGFVIPCLMFVWDAVSIAPYLIAVLLVMGVGLYDDLRELDFRGKLLSHLLAAGVLIAAGDFAALQWVGASGEAISLGLFGSLFAVLLLVGATNATNLSDGLDGLAAGLALISAMALAMLAYGQRDLLALALTVPMVGGLIGFLRFNAHPARVFMGDNGAYFLGFTLGYAVLQLALAAGPLSLFGLVSLLGVPMYDAVSVAVRRLIAGRSPFSADRSHIHHRFLETGLSHDGAVLAVYLVHILFVGVGLFSVHGSDLYAALVLAGCLLLLELVVWLARRQAQLAPAFSGRIGTLPVIRMAPLFLALWLLGYPVCALWAMGEPRLDFVWLAAGALLVLVGAALAQRRRAPLAEWTLADRAALYLLGAQAVYLCSATATLSVDRPLVAFLEGIWFAGSVAVIVLALVQRQGGLRLTALDVLVLVCILGASLLGDTNVEGRSVGLLKIIAWFYMVEVTLSLLTAPGHVRALRVAVGLVLLCALFWFLT